MTIFNRTKVIEKIPNTSTVISYLQCNVFAIN